MHSELKAIRFEIEQERRLLKKQIARDFLHPVGPLPLGGHRLNASATLGDDSTEDVRILKAELERLRALTTKQVARHALYPMLPLSCTPGGDSVLFWNIDNLALNVTYDDLIAVYEDQMITVDDDTSWSTDIDDYRLILWPTAKQNPTWWSSISDGTWCGRLFMTAEGDTEDVSDVSINYIDGKSSLTGIGMTAANNAGNGSVETDDLTAGMGSSFDLNNGSTTDGGTVLSITTIDSAEILTRNKPAGQFIDFVICGDSAMMTDDVGAFPTNEPFFQNLYDVVI